MPCTTVSTYPEAFHIAAQYSPVTPQPPPREKSPTPPSRLNTDNNDEPPDSHIPSTPKQGQTKASNIPGAVQTSVEAAKR